MKEVWKPVPSLPALMASSLGRVMHVAYEKAMPRGGTRKYGGTPTIGCLGDQGRRLMQYKRRTYKVHRLVAEAFLGPPPFKGAVVMHLDDDPSNNIVSNLKWATQKENLNTASFIAYCKSRRRA